MEAAILDEFRQILLGEAEMFRDAIEARDRERSKLHGYGPTKWSEVGDRLLAGILEELTDEDRLSSLEKSLERLRCLKERLQRSSTLHSLISARAYEIYCSRGSTSGHEKEDWLKAEQEIYTALAKALADEAIRRPPPYDWRDIP